MCGLFMKNIVHPIWIWRCRKFCNFFFPWQIYKYYRWCEIHKNKSFINCENWPIGLGDWRFASVCGVNSVPDMDNSYCDFTYDSSKYLNLKADHTIRTDTITHSWCVLRKCQMPLHVWLIVSMCWCAACAHLRKRARTVKTFMNRDRDVF